MENPREGKLQGVGCLPRCRTLTKINQITPMYFKDTASGGFFELTVLLEVFARPGLSSPDTAGIPREKSVPSLTHLLGQQVNVLLVPALRSIVELNQSQSLWRAQGSWEQSGMATSLGSTKLTKVRKDQGAGGTVQPFSACLEGKAPTPGTSPSGSPKSHWRDQRVGMRCH